MTFQLTTKEKKTDSTSWQLASGVFLRSQDTVYCNYMQLPYISDLIQRLPSLTCVMQNTSQCIANSFGMLLDPYHGTSAVIGCYRNNMNDV